MPIIDLLVKQIHLNLDKLKENDVIIILKAYPYITSEVKYSTKLLQDLNATVVDSAMQSQETVGQNFLINYLHCFFLIN